MATLVGIGPSQDLRFEVEPSTTLGRGPECTVRIADVLVSARHAEIRLGDDGQYRLVDLGATHGTFVGTTRIQDVVLRDGDELTLGATRLRFEDRDPRPIAVGAVSLRDDAHVVQHRVPVTPRARFPHADQLDLPDDARRDYERMRVAYEIAEALSVRRDLDSLLQEVLSRTFELLPAERAAILLRDPGSERMLPRVAARRGGGDADVVISTTILEDVVARRVGLISTDAGADIRFGSARSIDIEGIRSALVVPMLHGDELVGVIYLDAPTEGAFSTRDLDVMTTVAGQAALAVRNARLRQDVETQERVAAVAQVASGLAHDFNNVLAVVLNYAAAIQTEDGVPEESRLLAARIVKSAEQAARLTRKLGTLARGTSTELRAVDLDMVVGENVELLRRTLGRRVELRLERARQALPVLADTVEVEQILLNLALNARDAMGGSGELSLSLARVQRDDRAHALLTVTDTGGGMTPEVRARVFEPFFTTKPLGRGTGLGMVIIKRVVSAANGHIECVSTPGQGTTFRIWWPLTDDLPARAATADPVPAAGESVLVVDDDDGVREILVALLGRAGYTITHAADGEEAMATLTQRSEALDLLVLDTVLADMTGLQLAERARAIQPGLRVLYVSGTHPGELGSAPTGRNTFVAKPFTESDVLSGVRAALHELGHEVASSLRPVPLPVSFPDGATFLRRWDADSDSVLVPAAAPPPIGTLVSLRVRFEDDDREFRAHGRVILHVDIGGPGARIAIIPEEAARRDLILAAARGESVPYFRRNARRITLRLEARVTTEAGVAFAAATREISTRGIMLMTEHAIEPGTLVALRIQITGRREALRVAGRVRSVVREGPARGVGVEFVFSSAQQQEEVAAAVGALDASVTPAPVAT